MLDTRKCIVWGIGDDYEKILNQLLFEIHKGNITIEALVCRKQDQYCSSKDGFPVITKEEIHEITFDYLIITSLRYFKELKNEAIALGVPENQIIDGQKLLLPFFDFQRYSRLIENPVTILADDCWSGYAYHRLGLPFSTPLINIYWNPDEYAKFILDPLFYLSTELTMVTEGDLRTGVSPVGLLGDADRNVKLQFVHNADFAEARHQWDKRMARINPDNLFIKMGLTVTEKNKHLYLEAFEKVPYHKILFYFGAEEVEGAFKTERFIWRQKSQARVDTFNYNDYLRGNYWWDLDLLKLLTGDKNYSRY